VLEDHLGHRSKSSGPGSTVDGEALVIEGKALLMEQRAKRDLI
jgi:hypothetical protein